MFYISSNLDQYPTRDLPEQLERVVLEVERRIQSPVPIVAASMLSTMSIACQGLFDVQLPSGPTVPPSLFFLTVADSGERKSATDKVFTRSIMEYEHRQDEQREKALRDYEAKSDVWELRRQEIESRLKKAIREEKPTAELEGRLANLRCERPVLPKLPRLTYNDTTVEALLHGMNSTWPHAALVSDEAASVLNGRAMQQVAVFNELWDGKSEVRVDRRSSNSFVVHDGRITLSLMVQEKPFQQFRDRNGGAAWETGLLSRMLIARPTSRQGSRTYGDSDAGSVKDDEIMNWFSARVDELLNASYQRHVEGATRPVLQFDDQAKAKWAEFARHFESGLGYAGQLKDIGGFVSKISNNLARIAGLIHYFCQYEGPISGDTMWRAAALSEWYVYQHKRILGDQDSASFQEDCANQLEHWLRIQFNRSNGIRTHFKTSELYRLGPRKIRARDDMNMAIDSLSRKWKIRDFRNRKPSYIELNVGPGYTF